MLKRYILEVEGMDWENDCIFPGLSASEITQKDTLLNKDKDYHDFFPETSLFTPLIPKYIGDYPPEEIHTLTDFSNWIEKKPKGIIYPISKRFETLLKAYQLGHHSIYQAEVLHENKLIPYAVLQLGGLHYQDFINFDYSIFCDWHSRKKKRLSDKTYTVESVSALNNLIQEHFRIGFHKAVMLPAFEKIDMVYIYAYGIVISPRLKETIEAANLKGIAITACPIEFEIVKTRKLA